MRAAAPTAQRVQNSVQLRVMRGAHLHRPAVRVVRVDVMVVDQATAGARCVVEQDVNDAVVAGQLAPRTGVVDRSVNHAASLASTVAVDAASMEVVVAGAAQPQQVLRHVAAAV